MKNVVEIETSDLFSIIYYQYDEMIQYACIYPIHKQGCIGTYGSEATLAVL